MGNIYEEVYQTLLEEGCEDTDATEIVNHLYENGELDGVELLDESAFKAVRALAKAFGGTRKGWVNMQRATKYMSGGGLSPAMTRRTAGKAVNLKNVKTPRLPVSGKNVAPSSGKVGPVGGYTNPLKGGPAPNAASQPLLKNRSTRASQILQEPSGLGPDAGAAARSRLTNASRNPDAGVAAARRLRGGMPREATPAKPPVTPSAAPAPTPTTKGGPLATTGKGGGLQKPASIQQVKVKDLGAVQPSGTKNVSTAIAKTADKQTKALETAVGKAKGKPSGAATNPWDQFPKKAQPQRGLPTEGPSSRLPGRALPPGKQGGPLATTGKGGPAKTDSGSLVNSSDGSKSAAAQAKLDAAAKGTKGAGPATPLGAGGGALVKSSGGGLVKGASGGKAAVANNKLTTAVASAGKSGTKTGLRKRDIALGLGAAAVTYGLTQAIDKATRRKLNLDSPTVLADREEPKDNKPANVPSTGKPSGKPPTGKPSGKPSTGKPSGETKPPSAPSGPRPMTKIDSDVMDLMNMRARSLDRQGRTDDAKELRAKIEKKYGGRKPYGG